MAHTTVDIIAREPDLAPHKDVWEGLYRATSSEPSTSFEWTDALTRSHIEPGDRFRLLRLSRSGHVIGLVPLVARRVKVLGFPVTALSPLSERYNTHSDLLAREMDAETVSAFISALLTLDLRWDVFRMSKVLDGHPLLQHVETCLAQRRGVRQMRSGHGSYVLRLPDSFDRYLGDRSSKFRNHLKRSARRLMERGATQVIEVSTAADVASGFDMLLQVERASWKHAHGTAISAIAHQGRFYRDLCEGAAASGRLHLQILTVAGEPVAYNLGYIANDCYYYLKTSYHEQYKPLGPSTFLRARLVETLIGRGVRLLDFPAEPYEWERQWTDIVRWHKVLTIYGPTVAGRALAGVDRLRHRTSAGEQLQHADPRAVRPPKPAPVQ